MTFLTVSDISAAEAWIKNSSFDFYMPGVYMEYQYNTNNMPVDYETDGDGRTYMFWHYTHKSTYALFQTNEKYYGYNIVYTQSDTNNYYHDSNGIVSAVPMFGTIQELTNGTASQGQGWMLLMGDIASTDRVWITTNNSHNENIYAGILFNLRTYIGTSTSQLPYLDYELSYDCSIYGYTIEEYAAGLQTDLNNIKNQLQNQSNLTQQEVDIMQHQADQLEAQLKEIENQGITQDKILEETEEQTETQKGILEQITSFFSGFFDGLGQFFIDMIIPDDQNMKIMIDTFNYHLEEHFGILYAPLTYLGKLVSAFLTEPEGSFSLDLPGFEWQGQTFIKPYTFYMSDYPVVESIFAYVRIGTSALLGIHFINYLRMKYNQFFGGR